MCGGIELPKRRNKLLQRQCAGEYNSQFRAYCNITILQNDEVRNLSTDLLIYVKICPVMDEKVHDWLRSVTNKLTNFGLILSFLSN